VAASNVIAKRQSNSDTRSRLVLEAPRPIRKCYHGSFTNAWRGRAIGPINRLTAPTGATENTCSSRCSVMAASADLIQQLHGLLTATSNQSARTLADQVGVNRSVVNRVLYASALFTQTEASPPTWSVASAPPPPRRRRTSASVVESARIKSLLDWQSTQVVASELEVLTLWRSLMPAETLLREDELIDRDDLYELVGFDEGVLKEAAVQVAGLSGGLPSRVWLARARGLKPVRRPSVPFTPAPPPQPKSDAHLWATPDYSRIPGPSTPSRLGYSTRRDTCSHTGRCGC
jgi:hypothetical protein